MCIRDRQYEMLPSGKLIKRCGSKSETGDEGGQFVQSLGKKLRFKLKSKEEEDVDAIIADRLRDLE